MASLLLKPQVPAFTVPQLSEAMDILQERARDLTVFSTFPQYLPSKKHDCITTKCKTLLLQVPLEVVAPLDRRNLNGAELSLSGDHQFTNAGLAVALCKSWLQSTGNWEKLFQHVRVFYHNSIRS